MTDIPIAQVAFSGVDDQDQESRSQLRDLVIKNAIELADVNSQKQYLSESICSHLSPHEWGKNNIGDLVCLARQVYYERYCKSKNDHINDALAADFAITMMPFGRGADIVCTPDRPGLTIHEIHCAIKFVGARILGDIYDDEESLPLDWADSSPSIALRVLSKLEDVWWWHYSRHTDRWVIKVVSCSPWTRQEIAYLAEILSPEEIVDIATIVYQEHKHYAHPTILDFLSMTSRQVNSFFTLVASHSMAHTAPTDELTIRSSSVQALARETFLKFDPTSAEALDYFRFNVHLSLTCMRTRAINEMSVSAAIISLVHFVNNDHLPATLNGDYQPINGMMLELGLILLGSGLDLLGEQYMEAASLRIQERAVT